VRPRRGTRGIALVAVLWFVVLLSVVALGFQSVSRSGIRHAQATVDRARAEALADAGVALAITTLLEPAHHEALRTDGSERVYRFGADTVLLSIQDEGGRIDLNEAEAPLLQGLFVSAGVAPERARALADAVLDWRDDDDEPEPAGGEAAAYRAAGLPHGPANRRFYRVAELRQVLGIDRELFARVVPALTVHSGGWKVDTAKAPPAVVAALEAAGQPVQADAAGTGARVGRTRAAAARAFAARRQSVLPESSTDTYAIRAEARLGNGVRFVRTAVAQLTGEALEPYLIYHWGAAGE
jgi:general secretion pathway protein K